MSKTLRDVNVNVINNQQQQREAMKPSLGDSTSSNTGAVAALALSGSHVAPSNNNNNNPSRSHTPTELAEQHVHGDCHRRYIPSFQGVDLSRVDPVVCAEYCDDIITHLMERELTVRRDSKYLTRQPEVTERMRTILIDWLVDVAIKFKVHAETFYLAVDVVDRFLTDATVPRSQLQLVGVTAMFLAAKHEEIWAPEVRDCIYISANTYTQEEVVRMERDIAAVLNFRFTVPTPYPFMCNLLDRVGADVPLRHCASLFLESAALDYTMLEFKPSQIAAGAVFAAMYTLCGCDNKSDEDMVNNNNNNSGWLNLFRRACRAPIQAVVPCATRIVSHTRSLCAPNSRYMAIRRKYSSSRYSAVATLNLPEHIPENILLE